MNRSSAVAAAAAALALSSSPGAAPAFESDTIAGKTASGPLVITFIGHGTLMLEQGGTVIHVDPWTNLADYAVFPKADLILITHEHRDHLDLKAIGLVSKQSTKTIVSVSCGSQVKDAITMKNGEARKIYDVSIEAVAAYNIENKRPDGSPFHPKGNGNGYVVTLGGTRVYIAGDTENTPEMAALKHIDIAFLPMNLPYTMTPAMAAQAARAFKPRIVYPYHYGETVVAELTALLKDDEGIEVRVRNLK